MNKSPDVGEATKKHSALPMQQGGKGRILLRSALPTCPGLARPPAPNAGASSFGEFMAAANSLSLILRRLDEIERKLDHMFEELRVPAAIGY